MFEHLDKLQALEDRYIDLEAKISDPSVISDQAQWQKYTKAHAKLTDVVETYWAYQKLQKTYDDDQALLEMGESDEELAAMAEMEMKELAPQLEDYEKRLTILLLPKDPNDEKNIIMEIRAGAGGDEAALCWGPFPHVHPLCRNQGVARGTHGFQSYGAWWFQRSHLHGVRQRRLQPHEI